MSWGLVGLAGVLAGVTCGHAESAAKRQALEGVLPLHDAETIRRFALSPEEQKRALKDQQRVLTNSVEKWKMLTHILEYEGRSFQTVFYIERTEGGCYEPLYLPAFGYHVVCHDRPTYVMNLLALEVGEEKNGTRRTKPEHAMLVRIGCSEENLEAMAGLKCYGNVSVFHDGEDIPGWDVYQQRLASLQERYGDERISDTVTRSLIDFNIVRTVVAEALAQMNANQKMRFVVFYFKNGEEQAASSGGE